MGFVARTVLFRVPRSGFIAAGFTVFEAAQRRVLTGAVPAFVRVVDYRSAVHLWPLPLLDRLFALFGCGGALRGFDGLCLRNRCCCRPRGGP